MLSNLSKMEASAVERTSYEAPPWAHDETGAVRGVGLELEIGSLTLEETLRLVRDALGGLIVQGSPAEGKVEGTAFGKFKVEIDSLAIKERSYLRKLDWLGVDGDSAVAHPTSGAMLLTDTFIGFALGLLSATRLELYLRARRLLENG